MKREYQYIDPDNIYTDPETNILRNKLGIMDNDLLVATESILCARRLEELEINPLIIESAETLLKIHEFIFQDIYEWAGKVRIVQISKGGTQFLPTERFSEGFSYINELISKYRIILDDITKVAKNLAMILDAINHLHPFREGNGRVQREFIRVLAQEKGYRIDLNSADNRNFYDQYMLGTVNGNVSLLTELIYDALIASKIDK